MPIQLRYVSPILSQPLDINAVVGEQVAFFVTVSDPNDVLSYQWQVSTDEGVTYSNINGENDSSLILIALSSLHNNRYRVIISFIQPNPNSIHLATTDIEVNKVYTDGAILTIIGYVYPSNISNIEFIIP
jgi:hypothetical protein